MMPEFPMLPPEIRQGEPYPDPALYPVRENNPVESARVSSSRLARISELERENARLGRLLDAFRKNVSVTDNNGTVALLHVYVSDLDMWVHRWVLVPGAQR